MRFSATVLLVAMAGGAQASSLIVLEPANGHHGPSMIELAAGAPATIRSMVALGKAMPAAFDEKLSAIPAEPVPAKWLRQDALHIIRGGVAANERPRQTSARPARQHESSPLGAAEPPSAPETTEH